MLRYFFYFLFSAYVSLVHIAFADEPHWPAQVEDIDINLQPLGWLQTHENVGGHTINRHVDKSEDYLKNRIQSGNIFEASTFTNLSVAEQILSLGLWGNMPALDGWMKDKNAPDRLVIEISHPTAVGLGIRRNETQVSPRYGARIVLQKTKDKKSAFILTAYPHKRRP